MDKFNIRFAKTDENIIEAKEKSIEMPKYNHREDKMGKTEKRTRNMWYIMKILKMCIIVIWKERREWGTEPR